MSSKDQQFSLEEEDKKDEATGGFSEEELNLITTLRALGFQTTSGTMDDVKKLSLMVESMDKKKGVVKGADPLAPLDGKEAGTIGLGFPASSDPSTHYGLDGLASHTSTHFGLGYQVPPPSTPFGIGHHMPPGPTTTTFHGYPKFSIFFGEEGKGEVSWDTFRYEVNAIMLRKNYSHDQILFGMCRALKGSAGDKVRRLGVTASLQTVMEKLESAYGTVETKESVMRKFYTCEQKDNESVEKYASRLEELFDKAVQLNALRRGDTAILKQVLHTGLRKNMKHMSTYQCDKMDNFDEFKRELRRLEADLNGSPEKKPCKPVVLQDKKDTDSELRHLLKNISDRIEKLEKPASQDGEQSYGNRRQRRGWRGKGNGSRQNWNRSEDPKAEDTFSPVCFICNQKGHVQMKCPTILAQLVCFKCKGKGHHPKDCPKE